MNHCHNHQEQHQQEANHCHSHRTQSGWRSYDWLLFGVLLAAAVRTFIDPHSFQTWFGPTTLGLIVTVVVAAILDICSEGSTPVVAAEIFNQGGAAGNSFAFLMAEVATDYTEVMSIKDTMSSLKIALFLPLVTLPQVLIAGWLLNQV